LTRSEARHEGRPIPFIGHYRGIGLHNYQDEARLQVVRDAIDRVIDISDLVELVAFARNVHEPPEARLLARSKALAILESHDRQRHAISFDQIMATAVGLSTQAWRSPTHFCSDLDVPPRPGAPESERPVPREQCLPDDGWE
jgi:hypothetical protein